MYTGGLGVGVATVATGSAILLPDTGGNMFINYALAIAAGLIAWGIVYSRMQAKRF